MLWRADGFDFFTSALEWVLPAFAESHGREPVDECERVIRRSFSEGGCASAGSAEEREDATAAQPSSA